jgi:hypothetical protein
MPAILLGARLGAPLHRLLGGHFTLPKNAQTGFQLEQ